MKINENHENNENLFENSWELKWSGLFNTPYMASTSRHCLLIFLTESITSKILGWNSNRVFGSHSRKLCNIFNIFK